MPLNHLVTSFIVSSVTIVFIFLLRRIFSKQLSPKWQYNLWFLLLLALTLPLIPKQFIHFDNTSFMFHINDSNRASDSSIDNTEGTDPSNINWMQDFAVTVDQLNLKFLSVGLTWIWIVGMLIVSVLFLHAWFKLMKIKKATTALDNKDILHVFERCKHRFNIARPLNVGESLLVKSPMTFGLFNTYVVLPKRLEEWMSIKDIEYIFMHELHHYKNKDIATNYLMIMYQILYWFNPLVWIAFKEMRIDREIACDTAVLKYLDEQCHADYGNAIINFADRASHRKEIIWATQFNGPMKQIKKRIENIVSFTCESKWKKIKSISIFALAAVFVVGQVPFVSAMEIDNNRYEFDHKNVLYEDLSDYFTRHDGSFVLYDMKADQYTIYNKKHSTLRVSPNSTYKIYSALIGLETNVISSDNNKMKWNGTTNPYDSWNKDQNLSTAMRNSVTWYFQKLDRSIPRKTVKAYLQQMHYGNQDLSSGTNYWLESSLKISPVEQVQLLAAFYMNQFELEDKHIQTVKDALTLEANNGSKLSGKTGTGNVNGKNTNGWFIGYVEQKDNTYFFATNIQNKDNSYGSKAAKITLSILRDKGIY